MPRLKNIFLNAAFFLNVLLVFLFIFEHKLVGLPAWLHVAGRLHPVLLHFPIVLLVVVLLFEWIGLSKGKEDGWKKELEFLLAFTAVSASASAIFGLLLFHTGQYENGPTMLWHKWMGIGVSLVSWLLVWLRNRPVIIYQVVLMGAVTLTIVAGHYGGSITHGENFITQPLQLKPEKIKDVRKAIIFRDIIQPLLQEKCVGCHNPNKAKGELVLITKETILKGGENGSAVIPGNADTSILYQNLLLPIEDDRHMPPEGKPQLEPEEIALLRWWIDKGVEFDKTFAELNPPDSIHAIVQAKYGFGSPLEEIKIPFASTEKISSTNNDRIGIRQISRDKPYIDVFLANRKDLTVQDIKTIEPFKQQVVSVDLAGSIVTGNIMKQLATFPNIQKLHLENSDVDDADIKLFANHKFLEYVNVSNTNVSENVLAELSKMQALKKAYFYETNIAEQSLKSFAKAGIKIGYTPDLSSDTAYRGRLTEPIVNIDSTIFTNFATVEMEYRLKGVNIHYSTNGNDPDSASPVYTSPLKIDSSCKLKVIALRKGWQKSSIKLLSFIHTRYKIDKAVLSLAPHKRYRAQLDTTLIDQVRGSDSHNDGKSIGYEGEDVTVTLDLGNIKTASQVAVGYIVNHGGYLLAPANIEVWGSGEKNKPMKKLSVISSVVDTSFKSGATLECLIARFPNQGLRYIRVKVINRKKLPSWHPSKGTKSWMFLDEIGVG